MATWSEQHSCQSHSNIAAALCCYNDPTQIADKWVPNFVQAALASLVFGCRQDCESFAFASSIVTLTRQRGTLLRVALDDDDVMKEYSQVCEAEAKTAV
jgi:hypothetical protein